jgi:hypothetical protein
MPAIAHSVLIHRLVCCCPLDPCRTLCEPAQDIMRELLNPKPGLRLGARSFEALKKHRWFVQNGVDFAQLAHRQLPLPF